MTAQRPRPKILIADDNLRNLKYLSDILGGGDFELATAQNGLDAMEKVKTFHPDVLLLDIIMPGIDGYEMTRRLKKDRETSIIPIVLMTVRAEADDRVKGLEAGADEFIIKPIDQIELLTRIRSLIKLKKLRDRMRAQEGYMQLPPLYPAAEPNDGGKTILIVEDDPQTADLYDLLLKSKGYDTLLSKDGMEALQIIETNHLDLILLDIMLPHMDGFEVLKRLKASPLLAEIPVLIVSSISQPEDRVKAIDAGADDYLVKPVNTREMLARIKATIHKSCIRKKLKSDMDNFFELSVLDPLTGLYNRRYLKTVVESNIATSKRHSLSYFIIMMDIDDFKRINDTYGHLVGDGVLMGIGEILCERLRVCDIAARYGGEEFVVVLTNNSVQGACIFSERLRSIIETSHFPGVDEQKITVSIGIADVHPQDSCMETIIKRADDALYAAKQEGKNRVKGPL